MSVFIPFFFVEFGIGFRDIQAFTEHCFTMAGTKRENRVTSVDIYKKESPEAMLDTQPPNPSSPFKVMLWNLSFTFQLWLKPTHS